MRHFMGKERGKQDGVEEGPGAPVGRDFSRCNSLSVQIVISDPLNDSPFFSSDVSDNSSSGTFQVAPRNACLKPV